MSLRIQKLLWDAWNVEHIARHDISQLDIEWLLSNVRLKPIFQKGRSGTYCVWGNDRKDRYLLVILALRSEGIYYPVTARKMTAREKRNFIKRSK